ncbi:hypothetical protein U1Q18_052702 [Sarracenia purpurea var. burkii]
MQQQQAHDSAHTKNGEERSLRVWNPPDKGVYKLNFDGAWRKDGKSGMGMVIRDERGQTLLSLSERLKWSRSPESIEAWGALRAVEEALAMGFNKIQLEGDELAIIQTIRKKETKILGWKVT